MNKNLAKRFDEVRRRNAKRFCAKIRSKIIRNMRQAEAGYKRNIQNNEQDSFEWIKDTLDRTYRGCGDRYFYDAIKNREHCFESAKLLDDRTMNKQMYKRLSHCIRAAEYLNPIGE